MKQVITFLFIIFALTSVSSYAQLYQKGATDAKNLNVEASEVQVYYFHYNARCETCRTVESQAKDDVETLYDEAVSFQAVNLDEKSSKAIADKLKVSGQTLLVVKGDTKIDITNEGFLYATTKPEKLKTIIKEKVDNLLSL